MAPPIPGLRKPVQVPTRTAGDVLIGILAIMALAVLTIGVPIGLITVIGLPVPHGTAGLSVLTHQLDIPSILRVLSIVIWLAWLQLVWCVIVEIKAAVRNVGLPAQVPLAGATQSAAHRLVTAALLLFTAGAALSPAFAHAGPPRPGHTVSSVMPGTRGTQGPPSTAPQPVVPPTVAQSPSAEKVYVVRPPDGRYHESLWEIAENHLGDGRRYPEIYAMNKDRTQPDGSKLTIASLIRPGWILWMPQDAYGPGIETVSPDSAAPDSAAPDSAAAGQRRRRRASPRPGPGPPRARAGGHCRGRHRDAGHRRSRRCSAPEAPAPGRPPRVPFGPVTMPWPRRASRRRTRCRTPTSSRRRRCSRRGCWPRSAGGGVNSCGGGRSASGSPCRTGPRRWRRTRCGSARTSRRCGCSTSGSGSFPRRWPARTRRCRPCSRRTSGRRTSICGSPRPIPARPRRGRPPTAARCGGFRWTPRAARAWMAPAARSPPTPASCRSGRTRPAGSSSTWRSRTG